MAVDHISATKKNISIVNKFDHSFTMRIDPAHPCLAGHFPNDPIIPAALLVENIKLIIEDAFQGKSVCELSKLKLLLPILPGVDFGIGLELSKNNWVKTVVTQNENVCFTGNFLCIDQI